MQSPSSTDSAPLVSVLIVSYNRVADVTTNLQFLEKGQYANIEVIVVDNGSTDGSREFLASAGGIKVLQLESNLGPAEARNIGLASATGKYVLFLDSDAFMSRRGLKRAVEIMEAEPDMGILGLRVMNWFTGKIDQWFYAQTYEGYGRSRFDTYSFSAAGALVRAEAVGKAGGFWGELVIYNEEVDLSIRVIRAGYRVGYCGDASVYHRSLGDRRARSGKYWYYQIRNRIWICYRYYPFWARLRKIGVYSAVYLLKGLKNLQVMACLRGLMAGLGRRRIISEFTDKLSAAEMAKLDSLNPRRSVRWGQ